MNNENNSIEQKKEMQKKLKSQRAKTVIHNAAATRGNLDVVKLFIEEGYDVNLRDHDGCTLLFYAAWGGDVEIARYLYQFPLQEKQMENNGRKAIMK